MLYWNLYTKRNKVRTKKKFAILQISVKSKYFILYRMPKGDGPPQFYRIGLCKGKLGTIYNLTPCKRSVVGSIPTGGSTINKTCDSIRGNVLSPKGERSLPFYFMLNNIYTYFDEYIQYHRNFKKSCSRTIKSHQYNLKFFLHSVKKTDI